MRQDPNQEAQMKARVEKQNELSRMFQKIFDLPEGKLVLKEISKMCRENSPTYVDQNPYGTAYREGQRSIILGINSHINKTFNQTVQKEAKL